MKDKKKYKSALSEKEGVKQSHITDAKSIGKIKQKRRKTPSDQDLIDGVLSGNIAMLSRAITLVESKNQQHTEQSNALLKACLPHSGNSIRIGITGVPGVGKSTFIESFGKLLTKLGKKVAVLAVDPSSSLSKGSILGDKTRMESLVTDPNAFIRPSASGNSLGGVARKTRESIVLCEAAGYDVILVETVGVGQSETAVHSMVDFFLLLKIAGAGDELQGIKRGIIEMADLIVINKADGDNISRARLAKTEFSRALHLYPEKESGWQPKVTLCSSLENTGIEEIWGLIGEYIQQTKSGFFRRKRIEQNVYWMNETIKDKLLGSFFEKPEIKKAMASQMELIKENKTTPFAAAEYLLSLKN